MNNTSISMSTLNIRLTLGLSTSQITANPTYPIDIVIADDESAKCLNTPKIPKSLPPRPF